MKKNIITALFLATSLPLLAQPAGSRATVQQALGFEDQTSAALTGSHAYPPATVSADNTVRHTGHWSVHLQRDAQSAGAFSVITRSLPIDFVAELWKFAATCDSRTCPQTRVCGSVRMPMVK